MKKEESADIGRMILVPALITLAITLLRLVGELQGELGLPVHIRGGLGRLGPDAQAWLGWEAVEWRPGRLTIFQLVLVGAASHARRDGRGACDVRPAPARLIGSRSRPGARCNRDVDQHGKCHEARGRDAGEFVGEAERSRQKDHQSSGGGEHGE